MTAYTYQYADIDNAVNERIADFVKNHKELVDVKNDYRPSALDIARIRSFEGIIYDIDTLPAQNSEYHPPQGLYAEWKNADGSFEKSLQIILRLNDCGKALTVAGAQESCGEKCEYVRYTKKLWRLRLARVFTCCYLRFSKEIPLALPQAHKCCCCKKGK